MKFYIKETKLIEELNLVDPANGVCFLQDLMGNHDALPYYDCKLDAHVIELNEWKWWQDLVRDYQHAIERYHILLSECASNDYEDIKRMRSDIDCDLEYYPDELERICEEYEIED